MAIKEATADSGAGLEYNALVPATISVFSQVSGSDARIPNS